MFHKKIHYLIVKLFWSRLLLDNPIVNVPIITWRVDETVVHHGLLVRESVQILEETLNGLILCTLFKLIRQPYSLNMQRTYNKKTNRLQWSESDMLLAINSMMEGRMGYLLASHTYNVPKSSLEDRIKKIKAYKRAATMQNAVSAFSKTGICPLNPHIFTHADFAPSQTTEIPLRSTTDETTQDPLPRERTPSPQAGTSTDGQTFSVSTGLISPRNIMPITHIIKSKRPSTRRGKTAVLTESPYKNQFVEKATVSVNKISVKSKGCGKKSRKENCQEDSQCILCGDTVKLSPEMNGTNVQPVLNGLTKEDLQSKAYTSICKYHTTALTFVTVFINSPSNNIM
ncbi:unnamed protein product [Leptidea sinapis]|uniref:HTH psq-type domain-containing protein n=1 Tax=Leptidea sinapis TaxID=189913 RepID=A0A5E4QX86_9NEOP|nr:unnamed protein product [Leptidea sinapis]